MPRRITPIVTGETYHIFNRSVGGIQIFEGKKDYQRFLDATDFYRFPETPLRFSFFNRINKETRNEMLGSLHMSDPLVVLYAFACMPNHFHFVVKQTQSNGIQQFMRKLQNSYAKYFNVKYKRFGSLFQSQFKCVRIDTDEHFLHVVRYVHLNPITGYVIQTIDDLTDYLWTSYRNYINDTLYSMIDTGEVRSHFKTMIEFESFTRDQVDYQRQLSDMKHMLLDPDV